MSDLVEACSRHTNYKKLRHYLRTPSSAQRRNFQQQRLSCFFTALRYVVLLITSLQLISTTCTSVSQNKKCTASEESRFPTYLICVMTTHLSRHIIFIHVQFIFFRIGGENASTTDLTVYCSSALANAFNVTLLSI
jgi:hypothetical protein